MDKLAIGLWGCFFGVVAVILIGSAFAYAKSLQRIALNSAMSALASAMYVAVFLVGLPAPQADREAVFLALVSLLVSGLLTYLLFAVLGFLKSAAMRQRAASFLCGLLLGMLLMGWLLAAKTFFILCTATACLLGLVSSV